MSTGPASSPATGPAHAPEEGHPTMAQTPTDDALRLADQLDQLHREHCTLCCAELDSPKQPLPAKSYVNGLYRLLAPDSPEGRAAQPLPRLLVAMGRREDV